VQNRVHEASRQAEEALATELAKLVSHVTHWHSYQEVGRLQSYLPRINGQPVATD
jgi:hypothetical protein